MGSNSGGGNGSNGEPSTAPQGERWYNLSLGSSFNDHSSAKFCTLRYEFKPASIDKSQPGSLHKNKDNRVAVEFHNNQPGKPKVTFEGSNEDYKDNDGVLFFDGDTFRLERLRRAVKRLRHVRQPGESAASAAAVLTSATSVTAGVESRSPPLGKMAKSQPLTKTMVHSVPVEVERIDIGEPESPGAKPMGVRSMDYLSVIPNPSQPSQDRKANEQEEMPNRINAGGRVPNQNDTDGEIADVDVSDDDGVKGPNAAEALRAQANAEEQQQTSSSSGSSCSGSSSSDSEGSDDDSASSGGGIDI